MVSNNLVEIFAGYVNLEMDNAAQSRAERVSTHAH